MTNRYEDWEPRTYRRHFGDAHLQNVAHDDASVSYVLLDGVCIGEVRKGYPTFYATRYADNERRYFDSERDWDLTKLVLHWVAGESWAE